MRSYVLALAVGLLVGLIYALLNVRSPAPPVVALVGLLGMLAGEQAVSIIKRSLNKEPMTNSLLKQNCKEHVFGQLPATGGSKTFSKEPALDELDDTRALLPPYQRKHAVSLSEFTS
jgi:XapX domain-containing protein